MQPDECLQPEAAAVEMRFAEIALLAAGCFTPRLQSQAAALLALRRRNPRRVSARPRVPEAATASLAQEWARIRALHSYLRSTAVPLMVSDLRNDCTP